MDNNTILGGNRKSGYNKFRRNNNRPRQNRSGSGSDYSALGNVGQNNIGEPSNYSDRPRFDQNRRPNNNRRPNDNNRMPNNDRHSGNNSVNRPQSRRPWVNQSNQNQSTDSTRSSNNRPFNRNYRDDGRGSYDRDGNRRSSWDNNRRPNNSRPNNSNRNSRRPNYQPNYRSQQSSSLNAPTTSNVNTATTPSNVTTPSINTTMTTTPRQQTQTRRPYSANPRARRQPRPNYRPKADKKSTYLKPIEDTTANSTTSSDNPNDPHRYHLKVCTLSGTTEIGRNSNFVEYGDEILMIDCGLSFPGQEMLGVDYTIPNISYLKKNKHKIKGILITHGHLDHTGALSYVLEDLGFPPIYGGQYANALIKERLKEAELDDKAKLINAHRNEVFEIGHFKVTFIGVTHSIPNSFTIFVESPKGNVFFSGDYKMDATPANEPATDAEALLRIQGKINLALMESTNAEREGEALSDAVVAENLEKFIADAKGRVVVAAFASLVSRLYSLIQIAVKTNRKVFISGRSLQTAVRICRELQYIDIPDSLLVDESRMANFPDNQILFICTGSQAERFAALNRIALGEHKYFKIKENDLVLMSSSEVPGNEHAIEKMTDRILEKGAELIQSNIADIHGSGHGLQGDMKKMYDLIKPQVVMPIHGSLTKRYKNKRNFTKWGMPDDKVLLTTDGATWVYYPTTNEWKRGQTIESKPILIDGLGVGDISEIVLKDRSQLSQYGMVTVVMNLSTKSKHLIGNPRLVSRGFVYVKNSQELFNEMDRIIKAVHNEWLQSSHKRGRFEYEELMGGVERELKKFIYKKTEREPMILPVII